MTDAPVNPKQAAAERAVSLVQDGMCVGLGTGSTVFFFLLALGRRIAQEKLSLFCIPTSDTTIRLAAEHGIPLSEWTRGMHIDLVVDGADEVDPDFHLIKGGGGALVREKLVAVTADREVIVVDAGKLVPALGAFPLPVAVIPFAWQGTQERLAALFNVPATRRTTSDGTPFISDDGCFVLDMAFGGPFPLPPAEMEQRIKSVSGVVDVGLFIGLCHHVIIGHADGHVEERTLLPA